MAKSTGRSSFGRSPTGRRRGGTVTVIEDRVSRSYARTAKIAFYVVAVTIGLLASSVATAYVPHPILALLVGALIGVSVAALVAGFIAAWPVLRVIWWWTPEIIIALAWVYGFTWLAEHAPIGVHLAVTVLVGAAALIPRTRRFLTQLAWCLIVRHRLRTCFDQFIIANNTGSLPLVLWAKPTLVGESVWLWLRPGLSLADLEGKLDQIAVTCWATSVTVEPASANSAYVRVNIKRRQALTGTVVSPLTDELPTDARSEHVSEPKMVPTALDLPDVTADQVTATRADKPGTGNGKRPAKPAPVPATEDDDPNAEWR